MGAANHLDQRRALEVGIAQQRVDLVDIGLVMLAMVKIERFRGHVRGERILGERQVGKGEGHDRLQRLEVRFSPSTNCFNGGSTP